MARLTTQEKIPLGVLVLGFSVAITSSVLRVWKPVADEALMELRVRDVPSHLPLVGVWSRFGWSHPGPSQLYYLSAFYWLGGRSSVALLVGTLVMHAAFALAAWLMVRQLDVLSGTLVLAGAVLVLLSTEASKLRSPWNPYVMIVGGLALCAAAWSFGEGRRSGLIALFPIASFLAQAHIVVAPMVGSTCLAAIVLLARRRRGTLSPRPIALGIAIAFMMWVPPILQQLFAANGNMTAILRQDSRTPLGLIGALRVASDSLSFLPGAINPSTVSSDLLATDVWRFPFWGLGFAVAGISLVRSKNRTLLAGWVVAASSFAGSVVGVAMLNGSPYSYLAIAMRSSSVMVVAISLTSLVQALRSVSVGSVVRLVSGSTVALAAAFGVLQLATPNPQPYSDVTLSLFTEAVRSSAPGEAIAVDMEMTNWLQMVYAQGMMLQLERDGYRVESPTMGTALVGAHRTGMSSPYTIRVVDGPSAIKFRAEGWEHLAEEPQGDDVVAVLLGRKS